MSVVEDRNAVEEAVNEDITGINANQIGPPGEVGGNVFVDKIKCANGYCQKKSGLGEFERGNKEESTRPGGMVSHILHCTPWAR